MVSKLSNTPASSGSLKYLYFGKSYGFGWGSVGFSWPHLDMLWVSFKIMPTFFQKATNDSCYKKFIEIENEDYSSYALLWLLSIDSDFLLRFFAKVFKNTSIIVLIQTKLDFIPNRGLVNPIQTYKVILVYSSQQHHKNSLIFGKRFYLLLIHRFDLN